MIGWARDQLARGVLPTQELRLDGAVPAARVRRETMMDSAERWMTTRRSLSQRTRDLYGRVISKYRGDELWALPVDDVDVRDVQDYVGRLLAAGLGSSSVQKHMNVVRGALDQAEIDPNPARHRLVVLPSTSDTRAKDPPRGVDVRSVILAAPLAVARALALIEATGLRPIEAVAVRLEDIVDEAEPSFPSGCVTLRVRGTKTAGSLRRCPIPLELVELLEAGTVEPGRPLLRTKRGQPMSESGLSQMATRTIRKTGVPRFVLYDLRHRRVSRWLHDRHPPHVVALWAGHKAQQMFETYAHRLTDSDDAWRTLAEWREPDPREATSSRSA